MKTTWKIASVVVMGGLVMLGVSRRASAWGVGLSLHNVGDDTLCVDAKGDGKGAGTEVQIHKCNSSEAQRWALTRTTDNWSELVGPGGLCVSDKDSAKSAYLYGCTFKDAQLWKLEDGHLTHKSTGKCLTAANLADNQPVTIATCDKSPSQTWKFKQE